MSDAIETMNLKGCDQLLKAFKGKLPVVSVGILGSKNSRTGKNNSNATIGAYHEQPAGMEFGSTKMPQRSFLRVPLTDNLDKKIESSGALNKDVLAEVIRTGALKPWLQKIGVLAEEVIQGAFDSGGYGKWAPWSKGYTNNTGQILVDTQQLRDSITSEVT